LLEHRLTAPGFEALSLDGRSGSIDPFWTVDGFDSGILWDDGALRAETAAWKMLEARESLRIDQRAAGHPVPDWWEPTLGAWLDEALSGDDTTLMDLGGTVPADDLYAWAYSSFFPYVDWWVARIGYEEGLDLEGDLESEWPANQEGETVYVLRHPVQGVRVREWSMPMEDPDGWAREAFRAWQIRAYWCKEYLLYQAHTNI
jgi:hypothetical protein